MEFPKVSEKVLEIVKNQIMNQNGKGFKKYNQTIDQVKLDRYDWQQMVIEELVDGLQYAVKENGRLKELHQVQRRNFLINLESMLQDCVNEKQMCGLVGDLVMHDRFHQGMVLLTHVLKVYEECFGEGGL